MPVPILRAASKSCQSQPAFTGISATSPIAYNSSTGVISVASGYQIPTTSQITLINNSVQPDDISNMEVTTNKVTSISSSSTDTQYPSAKCVYDAIDNIHTEANVKDITPANRIINIDLSDTTQFSKESQTYGWTYNSTYGLCPENSKTIHGSGVANSFARLSSVALM